MQIKKFEGYGKGEDHFLNVPPLFTGTAFASDWRKKLGILKLFHACGAKMDQVSHNLSVLDIVFDDDQLRPMIPLLIKESIFSPSLRSNDGSTIVQLAVRHWDATLLEQLGKLSNFPKDQFNWKAANKRTPLQVAIDEPQELCEKQLVIAGLVSNLGRLEIDVNRSRAFILAFNTNDRKTMRNLYREGKDVHRPCVCFLSELNSANIRTLKKELPQAFYPTPETVLLTPTEIALVRGHQKVYQFLKGIPGEAALQIASQFEKASFLKLISHNELIIPDMDWSKVMMDFIDKVFAAEVIDEGEKLSLASFIAKNPSRQDLFFQWIAEESVLLAEFPYRISHSPALKNAPKALALLSVAEKFTAWYYAHFNELVKPKVTCLFNWLGCYEVCLL